MLQTRWQQLHTVGYNDFKCKSTSSSWDTVKAAEILAVLPVLHQRATSNYSLPTLSEEGRLNSEPSIKPFRTYTQQKRTHIYTRLERTKIVCIAGKGLSQGEGALFTHLFPSCLCGWKKEIELTLPKWEASLFSLPVVTGEFKHLQMMVSQVALTTLWLLVLTCPTSISLNLSHEVQDVSAQSHSLKPEHFRRLH